MLRRFVVGIDGSAGGRRAFEWAVSEAVDQVCAVHAVSPSLELAIASIQVDSTPLIARLTHELEGAWTATDHDGHPTVVTRLLEDTATNALITTAHAEHADAIVVGAHGHDAPPRIIGATASRLVHLADRPVIIVPSSEEPITAAEPQRIVVALGAQPTDDAELLRWATAAARGSTTQLEVVHVSRERDRSGDAGGLGRLQRWVADQALDIDAEVRISDEDPITALVDASVGAAMVVVGSHRSTRLAAYLTGALPNHLPTVSRCPVVLVPLTVARR